MNSNERNKSLVHGSQINLKKGELIEDSPSGISKFLLYFTYSFFTAINLLVNMDSGNIPPVTGQISDEFDIQSKEVGGLSSFVSIGTLIGGVISFSIIDIFPRKLVLFTFNCLIGLCLFLFPMFKSSIILYINRIAVGVFMVIY